MFNIYGYFSIINIQTFQKIQLLIKFSDIILLYLFAFRLEDSNYEGPCKSPQEALSKALSKNSLL